MLEIYKRLDEQVLRKIVETINDGGVVCFPTETVYALSVDASSDKAIEKIYQLKGREFCKPLSLLVGDIYQAKSIVHFDARAIALASRFFPGPLTIVLNTKEHHNVSSAVNEGMGTIGIRIPDNIIALKILKAIDRPIIGTSASTKSYADALDPEHIIKAMGDKIDLLLDLGMSDATVPSTIIDLSTDEPKILREGAISRDDIFRVIERINP